MPFSLVDIIYGGVIPLLAAGIIALLLRRVLPHDLGRRYSAAAGVLIGFSTGYALLKLGPWTPTAHWHWLPYALVAAAIVGPVAYAPGVRRFERWLLYLLAAVAAAWVLVPTWEDLSPSRAVHLLLFVAYVVTLAGLLEPLARRCSGPLLPAVLWATITSAAVVLALSGSLRFAQIALAGAGAIFGVMLIACVKWTDKWMIGIAPLFSILVVGSLLIGRVNSFSDVPLAAYVLVPLAPLNLWVLAVGPLSRLTGVKRFLLELALPTAVLAAAILLAVLSQAGGNGTDY